MEESNPPTTTGANGRFITPIYKKMEFSAFLFKTLFVINKIPHPLR